MASGHENFESGKRRPHDNEPHAFARHQLTQMSWSAKADHPRSQNKDVDGIFGVVVMDYAASIGFGSILSLARTFGHFCNDCVDG
ncbi:hypothetical protein, partial [Oryzibacter oryziterrae]|uniref:hypothetical protein n=1 Tax=Oryzibacter oryziterrae TaxID=2766474 RepID=UPI001F3AD586